MIIAAAMMVDGEVKALPAPARHGDIIAKWPLPDHKHGLQGFIDTDHGFVTRKEACRIAREEGQLDGRTKTGPKDILFSEDLW
ncbi:hypothetical protein [Paremcibacter congregatus]|uniref:hypothetical protein n=1 Tax=Paremcibacter congregatus TaxID=2043170 RepID=UPI003A8CEC67